MSSPKRVCTFHDGTTAVDPPPPPPAAIPVDVLLEILARVDVTTVVRCAATSKTVRRAILGDPTIGRRVEANGNGGLLLGVSYAITECRYYGDSKVSFVGQAPRQNHLGFDARGLKRRYSQPVASRGGLIVLLDRRSYPQWLYVWNNVTRRILLVQLPTANAAVVTVALLAVGDTGRSFRLLVVSISVWPQRSLSLRTQIYFKDDDRWGPDTEITDLPAEIPRCAPSRRQALVLGGGTAVHWLHNNDSGRSIVRLDIDDAKATLVALPPGCVRRSVDELQLAASTDEKLSLVVAEHCVISMWTLSAAAAPGEGGSGSARWTRQVVISREAIARVPTGRYEDLFLGFGELSSTVVLLMHHVGLVRINLRTKEALVLQGSDDDDIKEIEAAPAHDGLKKIEACLHEIDLPSILLAMKPY